VVDVYSDVAGRILSFGTDPTNKEESISYGSQVEVGTVLAHIDPAPYQFRLEQEQAGVMLGDAELAQARAKLELAEAQLQQVEDAHKGGSVPESELREARANFKVAQASVAAAEASLAQKKNALSEAKRNLTRATITSPAKGVVIDRRANIGQMATASANSPSLFLIADIKKLQIWASVNEADIGKIHPQQPVRFTLEALPGKVFGGKVKQIRLNAAMTHDVVTYTVVVAISSEMEGLLPYMTAEVMFE
jgi:HlyD family secretion protein